MFVPTDGQVLLNLIFRQPEYRAKLLHSCSSWALSDCVCEALSVPHCQWQWLVDERETAQLACQLMQIKSLLG